MSSFQVNIPELRALGGDVSGHATQLKKSVTDTTDELTPDLGQPGVWATIAQAHGAAQGWTEFFTGLAGRMDETGQSLVKAADLYQAADDRAAGRQGGPR